MTVSATYTAAGGTSLHQNLTVETWINGASTRYTDADGKGGVNYVNGAESPDTDDGTCSTSGCHGTGTPVWGSTLASPCFDCHDGTGENGGALSAASDMAPNEVNATQYVDTGHGLAEHEPVPS